MSNVKVFSYLKLLTAIVFWGASFIATKYALMELAPGMIIFLRLILAIVFLLIIVLFSGNKVIPEIKSLKGVFILALVAVFHLWIQVTGLKYTSASNTGWIIGLTPVFMAILGALFFNEKLTAVKSAGIIIAFTGLLLLISKGNITSIQLLSNKGDFLVLGSAFTWSVYSIVNKKISLKLSPTITILFLFIFMASMISPFIVSTGMVTIVFTISYTTWLSIIFLGIFCSGIAYVLWAQALREMDAVKVGTFLYLEPFVTAFTAMGLLNENITLLMILSGTIITAGIYIVNFSNKQN